jgi:hypothetical protein
MKNMNYGETNAYWYLRLNGFFLINNFVIHRTDEIAYSSDIDILGIRLPYVFLMFTQTQMAETRTVQVRNFEHTTNFCGISLYQKVTHLN